MANETGNARASSTSVPRVWQASGGRRLTLCFVFLILLPFYASIGPMLYQRVTRGLVVDTIWLGLLGLAFTVLMAIILAELMNSVRTRIELGDQAVKATVPLFKRGPVPLFRFNSREIPYADIAGVDTRTEAYGGALAPVLLKSTRINLANGDKLVLGYTDPNDPDSVFPYPDIGAAIAARAGKTVVDHGIVHRSIGKRILGATSAASENVPLDTATIEAINRSHARNVRSVVIGLAALILAGIAIDFVTASRTTFAEFGAFGPRIDASAGAVPAKKR